MLLALVTVSSHASTTTGMPAQGNRSLNPQQLLLLREARNLFYHVADGVWPDWSKVELTTLVIDRDFEFLVSSPHDRSPGGGFKRLNQSLEEHPVFRRPRTLSQNLRASFPIEGIPTAVVGSWDSRVESANEWVITLCHEWFHILQFERGEQEKATALGLGTPSDPSWQIGFPFPYDDPDVVSSLRLLGHALYDFTSGWDRMRQGGQRAYLAGLVSAALRNVRTILNLKYGAEAFRFFQFQTWREGVARYAEVEAARLAAAAEAEGYTYIEGFDKLPNQQTYRRLWREVAVNHFAMIRMIGLTREENRMMFYPIGHGLAHMLDALGYEWKDRYFERGVWLDHLLADALKEQSW